MRPRSQFVSTLAVASLAMVALAACAGSEPEAVAPSAPASASTVPSQEATSAPVPSGAASGAPGSSPSPTAADLSRFYDQTIDWTNCGSADCGHLVVPLDYSDPEGPTIKLGITRVKAKGDAIGSLFVEIGRAHV